MTGHAAIAMLVGAAIGPLAGSDPGKAVTLATVLAVLTAGVLFLMARLRLGIAADFLSSLAPLGFMNGAAIMIVASQLGTLCGISFPNVNHVSGTAIVGTGVTATVSSSATLELAGSVSALSSGANRVNVTNNSSAAAGILVSGTNQVGGAIDGSGNTVVNAGSDLTANHIIQAALVIGGTAGSHSLVTIAASDAFGNPLDQSSGLALAGSLTPSGPFGASDLGSASVSSATADIADLAVVAMGKSVGSDNPAPVPEPSTLLLALLAVLGVVSTQFARRYFRCQTV